MLTSGARDIPERQQTLRAAIDWSHSLLAESEQRLFRRMAVFAGGCTFADVEAVCADSGEFVLDELESLVDKALVQADVHGDRLWMLQTIGEYARERLEAAGETREVVLRHARRYAEPRGRSATASRAPIRSVPSNGALAEEGNLQAALDALQATAKDGDAAAPEAGLQMCGDLWLYWHIRGKNLTSREYATAFLDADTGRSPTEGRAGGRLHSRAWRQTCWVSSSGRTTSGQRRIASPPECGRARLCIAALCQGVGLIRFDLEAGLGWTRDSIERSREPSASRGPRRLPQHSTASSTPSRATSTPPTRGTHRRSRSSAESATRKEPAVARRPRRVGIRLR